MKALNDLAKIRLDVDEFGFGTTGKTTAESGILEELPDELFYYGFWSFAFENSWMDEKGLKKIYDYWKNKIGQRVFWTALSERGNIIEMDDKTTYAFVKLTSLIAEDNPDSTAHNLHADGAGSFGMEQ